jgi:hypothetical protein
MASEVSIFTMSSDVRRQKKGHKAHKKEPLFAFGGSVPDC